MANNDGSNAVGMVAILVIVLIAAGIGYYFYMAGPRTVVTEPTKIESTTVTAPSNTTTTTTPSTTKETTTKSY